MLYAVLWHNTVGRAVLRRLLACAFCAFLSLTCQQLLLLLAPVYEAVCALRQGAEVRAVRGGNAL